MISDTCYDRGPVIAGGADSLGQIAVLLPDAGDVLDVGCATGRLGQYLQQNTSCSVDGIEINAEAAAQARMHYRSIYAIDLDQPSQLDQLSRRYDVIILADVLEHLRYPQEVLQALVGRLAPGGRFLVSLPNVAHVAVAANLLRGRFPYQEQGLLDRTHLRFFTRDSAFELFQACGLPNVALRSRVVVGAQGTELNQVFSSGLLPEEAAALARMPEGSTYQFIFEVAADSSSLPFSEPPDQAAAAAPALFLLVQLFYRHAGSDDVHSLGAKLSFSGDPGLVSFYLPLGLAWLRFDPADLIGIVRIKTLRLRDRFGQEIWRLKITDQITEISQPLTLEWDANAPAGPELLVYSSHSDPWFVLPAPEEVLAQAATLEVALDWPRSHDYWILERRFSSDKKNLESEVARLASDVGASAAELAILRQALSVAEQVHAHLEGEHLRLVENLQRPFFLFKCLIKRLLGRACP